MAINGYGIVFLAPSSDQLLLASLQDRNGSVIFYGARYLSLLIAGEFIEGLY